MDCKADEGFRAGPDGLFRASGRHIRLVTDIPSRDTAADLVASFDAAVPQWAAFWGIDVDSLAKWTVDAHVMRDARPFRDNGLLPRGVGDFPFGTASGNQIWIHEQPSRYYNRHLLLHEGVHVLMFGVFGGAGPTWFMEGTAELLAVHSGDHRQTVIGGVPAGREAVPEWGRFKILSQQRDANNVKTIEDVMRLPRKLRGDVESYGWSWLAVMMLSQYPHTRDELIQAAKRNGADSTSGFTRDLYQRMYKQWPVVRARWTMMILEMDYGFDWSREAIDVAIDDPTFTGGAIELSVAADRGWQSAGFRFPAGTVIDVDAAGQVILDETTRPWVSLPAGITFQHHRGQPLGRLIACVLPVETRDVGRLELPDILAIGEGERITLEQPAWLLFRVNDRVGDTADNRGRFDVRVKKAN